MYSGARFVYYGGPVAIMAATLRPSGSPWAPQMHPPTQFLHLRCRSQHCGMRVRPPPIPPTMTWWHPQSDWQKYVVTILKLILCHQGRPGPMPGMHSCSLWVPSGLSLGPNPYLRFGRPIKNNLNWKLFERFPGGTPGGNRLPPGNPRDFILRT